MYVIFLLPLPTIVLLLITIITICYLVHPEHAVYGGTGLAGTRCCLEFSKWYEYSNADTVVLYSPRGITTRIYVQEST